jgi:hypothetical protein
MIGLLWLKIPSLRTFRGFNVVNDEKELLRLNLGIIETINPTYREVGLVRPNASSF